MKKINQWKSEQIEKLFPLYPNFDEATVPGYTVEGYPSNSQLTPRRQAGDENLSALGMLESRQRSSYTQFLTMTKAIIITFFDIDQKRKRKNSADKKSERIKNRRRKRNRLSGVRGSALFRICISLPLLGKIPCFGSTTSLLPRPIVTLFEIFRRRLVFCACGDGNAAAYGFMLENLAGRVRRETPEYSSYTRYSAKSQKRANACKVFPTPRFSALTDENGRGNKAARQS